MALLTFRLFLVGQIDLPFLSFFGPQVISNSVFSFVWETVNSHFHFWAKLLQLNYCSRPPNIAVCIHRLEYSQPCCSKLNQFYTSPKNNLFVFNCVQKGNSLQYSKRDEIIITNNGKDAKLLCSFQWQRVASNKKKLRE